MIIYIGTVGTSKGSVTGNGEGIYTLRDGNTNITNAYQTSMITLSKDRKTLYALSESRDFGGLNGSGGGVLSFRIQKDGTLTQLNSTLSYGSRPCSLTVSEDGKYLLVANHGSHSAVVCGYDLIDGKPVLNRKLDDSGIAVFRLNEDGTIGELSDVKVFDGHGYWCHGQGQSTSHVHCVRMDGNTVIACNRGADMIEVLRLDKEGKLHLLKRNKVRYGYAPRHMEIIDHYIYVVHENYPALSVYELNKDNGELREIQCIETMPVDYYETYPLPHFEKEEADENEVSTTGMTDRNRAMPSDIHSENGYVYVSNRVYGGKGCIMCYQVQEDHMLSSVFCLPLEGKDPRGFAVYEEQLYVGLLDCNRVEVYPLYNGIPQTCTKVYEVNAPASMQVMETEK